MFQIQRTHSDAVVPSRGSVESAGWDLTTIESAEIPSLGRQLFGTGLKMRIPSGYYGRIAPRSGLSLNKGLMVGAGVIDSDYRGEVRILLVNPTGETVRIEKGMKIAQLVIEKIWEGECVEVEDVDVKETERGEGGFGSTGK